MAKKAKGKHRLDKFYHLAKEQGYRSRAAFKLIQLNRKYDFLASCRTLLDLCAAPGGWCQVAAKYMPMSSLIIGVDLVPIRPIRGVKTLVGDITTQKTRQAIRKEAGGNLMDAVVHDGAPNVGGAWASEAYSQAVLVLEALRLATEFLAPRGTFVSKIFRSADYTALLYAFNQLFDKVEATKPAASRGASAEIFVICRGYKAPAKIDQRLLDPKHLFKEVEEAPQAGGPDALLRGQAKAKRQRDGYQEGLSLVHKELPAADFILSDSPVDMLGHVSRLVLDGPISESGDGDAQAARAAAAVRSSAVTTAEVRALCADLGVLGRSEFKQLLKWRLLIKRDLALEDKAAAALVAPPGQQDSDAMNGPEKAEAAEAALLAEMASVQQRLAQAGKRDKRKKRELKKKARMRAAQLAQAEGIGDDVGPDELFSLSTLKARAAGEVVAEAAAPGEEELAALAAPSDDEDEQAASAASGSEDDPDDQHRQYDTMLDDYLEDNYRAYKARQGMREQALAAKRARLGQPSELADAADSADELAQPADGAALQSESEEDEEEEEGGGLLVRYDEQRAGHRSDPAALTQQWFAQDIFNQPALASSLEPDVQRIGQVASAPNHKAPVKTAAAASAPGSTAAGAACDQATAGLLEDEEGALDQTRLLSGRQAGTSGGQRAETAGFEEVPLAPEPAGSDSEDMDDLDDLDERGQAEVLALARKMIRSKSKQELLDAAYHRYAFHDDQLPKWFAEDERRHMRRPELVSREELDEQKARLRAVDVRPIKKVAEAKARKRKRLAVRLAAVRTKAEAVVGQADMPERAKAREIEKLYARARASAAGKKGSKKGKGTRSEQRHGNKGPALDPRMRKDKRQVKLKRKQKANHGRLPTGAKGGVKKPPKPGKNRRR